ncbi:MAG: alpha/beta hydrolase [Bacteroidota bacterium]
MKRLLLILPLCFALANAWSQSQTLNLYPEGIPCKNDLIEEAKEGKDGILRISKVHEPILDVYLPDSANGSAVVICPGGGYTILAWDWEGSSMAEWFNTMGITAFVLKYRLPHWETEECRSEVALMDAQRAMRLVRSKAEEYDLDAEKVGIMGFSAGGHLASTLATHFDSGDKDAPLVVERYGCRPDFAILMYPVVSFDPEIAHGGSRRNLLGKESSAEEERYYSNEKQVTSETPPTIMIHADDDKAVIPENSVNFYLALRKYGIPAALHIFSQGGHGFSFAEGKGAVEMWPQVCEAWLKERGIL